MKERFELVIESLLAQEVICEISSPDLFRYLDSAVNYAEVSSFLHRIARKVVKTNDGQGYYCAYSSIEDTSKRKAALKQFQSQLENLEPLVEWLRLVRSVDIDSRPIESGTRLVESKLLAAIEESSHNIEALNKIASAFKKSATAKNPKGKLSAVLDYLTEAGFLKTAGSSGAVYAATAKWSLLYDQLEFIHSLEGYLLPEDEQAIQNPQMDLIDGV